MKTIALLFFGLLGMGFLFMACNKTDTTPGTPAVQMNATINGANWTTTLGGVYYQYDTTRHVETYIAGGSIKVNDSITQSVLISIDSCTGLGTYKITKNGPYRCVYGVSNSYTPQSSTVDTATSGQVIINSLSKTLSQGIFNFSTGQETVIGGTYNLHLQN